MKPDCPRCGYDQSGVIDSWKESCPLTGTCSECGLKMEWALVIRPELRPVVPGFYEHAKHWWNLRWAWRTWWWSLRPWSFTDRVSYRIHHSRLLLWLPVLLLSAHVFRALCLNVAALLLARSSRSPVRTSRVSLDLVNAWTRPLGMIRSSHDSVSGKVAATWWQWDGLPAHVAVGLGVLIAFPVALLVIWCAQRDNGDLRPRRVLRYAIYSAAWAPLYALVLAGSALHWLLANVTMLYLGSTHFIRYPLHALLSPEVWIPIVAVWPAIWWWFAVNRALRPRSPVLVWIAAVIQAELIAAIMLLFFPRVAIQLGLL